LKRYPILNIGVDSVDMDQALAQIQGFIEKDDRAYTVFAANPEKNFSVTSNLVLHKSYQEADLLIPDGIGIVLAARTLHGTQLKRVPGCELMEKICSMAVEKGVGIFIYGAREEVNQRAVRVLRQRYPGIDIVDHVNGYWPDEKMDELINRINISRAQILFLALGSPKQEEWLAENKKKLSHVRVCQGIGGTLDVLSGNVKRAPAVFCNAGLEWFYRLMVEPKRIKRQIVLPLFVIKVLLAKIKTWATG